MYNSNTVPYCNRETRRKVERYQRKHPDLTFTQAYNKIFGTKYNEPENYQDTSLPQDFQEKQQELTQKINQGIKGVLMNV